MNIVVDAICDICAWHNLKKKLAYHVVRPIAMKHCLAGMQSAVYQAMYPAVQAVHAHLERVLTCTLGSGHSRMQADMLGYAAVCT